MHTRETPSIQLRTTSHRTVLQRAACVLAASLLLACGGGGGGVAPTDAIAIDAPVAAPVVPQLSVVAGALGGNGYKNGSGSEVRMGLVEATAFEPDGDLLIADAQNGKIRRITPEGVTSDVAGGDIAAYSLAVEADGSILASDVRRIYRISPAGVRTVLAGGDALGNVDGAAASATLFYPMGLTVAGSRIYFANRGTHTIRMLTGGTVSTIAGIPNTPGNDSGPGNASTFRSPQGLALFSSPGLSLLLIADTGNHSIRSLVVGTSSLDPTELYRVRNAAGSTLGSTGRGLADGTTTIARFSFPTSIAAVASNYLVADAGNARIRALNINTGAVTTLIGPPTALGNPQQGTADGAAASARFLAPTGLSVVLAGGGTSRIAIADQANPVVRTALLTDGTVSTLAGQSASNGTVNGAADAARFHGELSALSVLPNGALVAAQGGENDNTQRMIRRIDAGGNVSSVATSGDYIYAMASNASGDTWYMTSRALFKLGATGTSTLVAGSTTSEGYADGPAASARFDFPRAITVTDDGTVFVAEEASHRIRKVTPAGVVSTLAGNGTAGDTDGTGSAARIQSVKDMAMERTTGNLIVAESTGTLRVVTPAGAVTTLPGTGSCLGRIALDSAGLIYCGLEQRITRISPAGTETVVWDAPADGSRSVRTGSDSPSFNRIGQFRLLRETASSLEFAVTDDNERAVLKATLPK